MSAPRLGARTINRRDANTIVRLLGLLQEHLESAIESCLADGETEPQEEWLKAEVAIDRTTLGDIKRLLLTLTTQTSPPSKTSDESRRDSGAAQVHTQQSGGDV